MTSKRKYPSNIKTEVAKRLYDEGLIMPADEVQRLKNNRLQERQKILDKSRIKNYRFNPFPNRRQRRMMAKQAGYLRRNPQGENGWPMYRAMPEKVTQTVRNDGVPNAATASR